MRNSFHTSNGWCLARALAFLCCGVHSKKDRDVITVWIGDPTAVMPAEYAKNRSALAATLAVFRQTWPNFTMSQTLHPVIWLWFGVDKARSHLHMDCLAKFVAYIEDTSICNSNLPGLNEQVRCRDLHSCGGFNF